MLSADATLTAVMTQAVYVGDAVGVKVPVSVAVGVRV